MKLKTSCAICLSKKSTPEWMSVDLSDPGYLVLECPDNHISISLLPVHKFALLFDLASMGFLDGYYREAVSGFYVSIERFLEFYSHVVLMHRGMSHEDIKQGWKLLKTQSERQLGAFLTLYMAEQKTPCKYLSRDMIELRNNVVHKGYFPTKQEAYKFGKTIFEFIFERIVELRNGYSKEISDLTASILSDQKDAALLKYGEKNIKILVQGLPTILNRFIIEEDITKVFFDDSLEKLKAYRENIWKNE